MRDHMRAYAAIKREGEYYTIDLPPGETVVRCLIDYQLTLQLSKSGLSIVVEQPFVLEAQRRSSVIELDPPERLAPVLALTRKRVQSIRIHESGTLEVTFEGHKLTVEPHKSYEAWQVNGPVGVIAVCLAGGELAVWSA